MQVSNCRHYFPISVNIVQFYIQFRTVFSDFERYHPVLEAIIQVCRIQCDFG